LTYIQVKNPSEVDILILGFRRWPGIFKVSKGSGVKEIVQAIIEGTAVTIIAPGEQWKFQFMKGPHREERPIGRIHVLIRWRRSNCTWLPQVPVWLSTTQRHLDRMAGGSQRSQE
jgi:hypothetical protein